MTKKSTYEKSEQTCNKAKKEFPHKHSEAALSEKGLKLEAIVKAFDGLMYLCSQDYRIEYMNEKYIKRIGYDATGQICYKALHNRDSICPWCLINRILKGETVRCEVLTPKSSWYYVVSTPIYHPDGSFSKLAMIIDISGRKQAEQSIEQKVEEQKLLLDNIQTQIWYLRNAKTYGAVNKAHADFLNLGKKEVEYKTLYDTLSKEEARAFIAHNMKVFDQKIKVQTEEWVINGRGEKRLLSTKEMLNMLFVQGKISPITEKQRNHYDRVKNALTLPWKQPAMLYGTGTLFQIKLISTPVSIQCSVMNPMNCHRISKPGKL